MTKVKQKSNTVIDKLTCHFYRLRGGGRGILFVSRYNLPAPPIGFRKVPIIPSPPHWHFIGSQFSIVFLYTLLATTDLPSLSFWEPWYSSAQKNPSPPQAIKTTLPWGKFFKGFDVAIETYLIFSEKVVDLFNCGWKFVRIHFRRSKWKYFLIDPTNDKSVSVLCLLDWKCFDALNTSFTCFSRGNRTSSNKSELYFSSAF